MTADKTIDDKLAELERQEQQLRNRRNRLKAQKLDQLEAEQRKDDNRLKVLTGVAVLHAVKQGQVPQEWLDDILDRNITNERDRQFLQRLREKQAQAEAEDTKTAVGQDAGESAADLSPSPHLDSEPVQSVAAEPAAEPELGAADAAYRRTEPFEQESESAASPDAAMAAEGASERPQEAISAFDPYQRRA